jgi:hypothetical protein
MEITVVDGDHMVWKIIKKIEDVFLSTNLRTLLLWFNGFLFFNVFLFFIVATVAFTTVIAPYAVIISIRLTFSLRGIVQVAACLNIAIAISTVVSTESSLLARIGASVVKVAANQDAAIVDPRAALVLALVAIIVVVAAPKAVLRGAALIHATDPFAIGILATAAVGIIPARVSVVSNTAFVLLAIPVTLTITVFFNGVATVCAILTTIRFGIAVGKGSQLFNFGKDSSERQGSGWGARQGHGGGTEEDGNGR